MVVVVVDSLAVRKRNWRDKQLRVEENHDCP